MYDLCGKIFGRLTVLERTGTSKGGHPLWWVLCSCGVKKEVLGRYLRNGDTKSCGCAHSEQLAARNTTHGMAKTPTYVTWSTMIDRCTNPKTPSYKYYGGRSIRVCDRWLKFEDFFADMGTRPNGKTLDRKDNNKGYSKDNCRWATDIEQGRNTCRNVVIEYKGVSRCLSEWSMVENISYPALTYRIRKGWSPKKALTTPTRGYTDKK